MLRGFLYFGISHLGTHRNCQREFPHAPAICDGALPAPCGDGELTMSGPTKLIFFPPEVAEGNLSPLLQQFAEDKLPQGNELGAMMNTLDFAVRGYNDDPSEVYAILEVRRFYQKLHREWPYALFFCDLREESLLMLTMCCLQNLEGKSTGGPLSKVAVDAEELIEFVLAGWGPLKEMCERAGFSERAIYDRAKAVMGYYHLPFDVPPPKRVNGPKRF